MLRCDRPEKPRKIYVIPKQSKKRLKEISDGTFKPKQPKAIKARSDKRAKQEKEYLKIRKDYLEFFDTCQARIKCLGAKSTEVHHKAGRVGELLTDEFNFIAICHDCHVWAELNPEQAKALNISSNRL